MASVGIKENGKGSKSRFTSSRSVPLHFLGAALKERLMTEGLNEASSFPQCKSSVRRQRARMLELGVVHHQLSQSPSMGDVLYDASRKALLTTSRVAWLAEMRLPKQTRRWNGDVWVGHEFRCLLYHPPRGLSMVLVLVRLVLSSVVGLLLGTAPQHHQRCGCSWVRIPAIHIRELMLNSTSSKLQGC